MEGWKVGTLQIGGLWVGEVRRGTAGARRLTAQVVLVAILVFLGLGLRLAPIAVHRFHQDEACYSHWALLVATGQDPLLETVRVDKPPLFVYTLALLFRWLGPSEVIARLPGEVASMVSLLLLYRLARRLYDERTALLALGFYALSPFAIAFAPTALTDPLLTLWVLAALLCAVQGRWGWAGVMLGLAMATKQQGLLFVPLVLMVSWLQVRLQGRHTFKVRRTSQVVGKVGAGILAVMGPVTLWDALRWHVAPSYWDASIAAYGGLGFTPLAELGERLVGWLRLLSLVTGSPLLNVVLVGWVLVWVVGWLRGWKVGRLEDWKAGRTENWDNLPISQSPSLPISQSPSLPVSCSSSSPELILVGFIAIYLLAHWLLRFNVWDRYLLPLVPLLCLLLARFASWQVRRLESCRFVSIPCSPAHPVTLSPGHLVTRSPCHLVTRSPCHPVTWSLAPLFICMLALSLLLPPAVQAARGAYPVGGDCGAHQGLEQVIAYLRQEVPPGSVLYHHWLGWHYDFYLFDAPLERRWYPDPWTLAEDAARVSSEAYIVFPAWRSPDLVRRVLSQHGMRLEPRLTAYRRNGSRSFVLYRIRKVRGQGGARRICQKQLKKPVFCEKTGFWLTTFACTRTR